MSSPMSYESVLSREERATFALRALYADCGYARYKMSKFEEYDLYARNKDFLVSDNIITFTDTDGRLLALKPDVTLSILKNSRAAEGLTKVFYNENVYRVSGSTKNFREIMQVGLECIGDVGNDEIREVLSLAAKSLNTLSESYVLEVSELDLVNALIKHFGISRGGAKAIITSLSKKNTDGIRAVCASEGLGEAAVEAFLLLATAYGAPSAVLPRLEALKLDDECAGAIDSLCSALEGLSGNVSIDFSVTGDSNYYNGVAFVGFIEGVPTDILRGGQYDKLAERVIGRKSGAIGFAVYLDELEKQRG